MRGDGTWWNTSSFDDDVASASFNSRWDDLQGTFDNSTGAQTNLTLTTFDTSGFQTLFFRHDQDNHFSMRFQFPHKWSRTIVKPHLHLLPAAQPTTNVTGTVEIGYQYAWANNSTLTTWSSGSTQMQISGSMYLIPQHVALGDVSPPTNPKNSAILLMRIMRSGSATSDTYTTSNPIGTSQCNLAILGCDVHFQQANAGSVTELVS